MSESCKTCAYRKTVTAPDRSLVQNCKRLPPTVVVLLIQTGTGMTQQPTAMFPGVDMDDWCGEWASRDTTVTHEGKIVGRFPMLDGT